MQFKKGAEIVAGKGEKIGTLDRVVIDPKTKEVASLVGKSGLLLTEDKLISMDLVNSVTPERIAVNVSREELDELPRYEEVHYVPLDREGDDVGEPEAYYWYPPAFGLHSMGQYPPFPQLLYIRKTERNIPENMIALREGARVITSEGKHVGEIESLIVDETTDHVTHLVVSSGLFLKERKLVPTYWLTDVLEEEVHLAVESGFLDSLPEYRSEGGPMHE